MRRELEEVREKLNKIVDFDPFDLDEAILISQVMDKLIIEYYKSELNNDILPDGGYKKLILKTQKV